MQRDKEKAAKEQAAQKAIDQPESEEEVSSDSSEEEDGDYFTQANADVDAIVTTPKTAKYHVADFLKLSYEEGGRIEMPWYTAAKILAKKEAPVSKVHDKKNFKGLHESEEVAKTLVRNSLKT